MLHHWKDLLEFIPFFGIINQTHGNGGNGGAKVFFVRLLEAAITGAVITILLNHTSIKVLSIEISNLKSSVTETKNMIKEAKTELKTDLSDSKEAVNKRVDILESWIKDLENSKRR